MKIYVASSWRNPIQDVIVANLRSVGHAVYDFKNPAQGNNGFSWKQIDALWPESLKHPIAQGEFRLDMDALKWCDACVLVLPCGRSAHLELGWACGAGKKTIALALPETGPHEPELMYLMLDAVCVDQHQLREKLRELERQLT